MHDDHILLLLLVFYHFGVLTPATFIYGLYFYVAYSFRLALLRAME